MFTGYTKLVFRGNLHLRAQAYCRNRLVRKKKEALKINSPVHYVRTKCNRTYFWQSPNEQFNKLNQNCLIGRVKNTLARRRCEIRKSISRLRGLSLIFIDTSSRA